MGLASFIGETPLRLDDTLRSAQGHNPFRATDEAGLTRAYRDAHIRYLRLIPEPRFTVFGRPIIKRPAPSDEIESAKRFLMQARAELLRFWALSEAGDPASTASEQEVLR